ncbi:hypothetical protein JCM10213v2_009280 [Rhodosporidiobolus nylandii]
MEESPPSFARTASPPHVNSSSLGSKTRFEDRKVHLDSYETASALGSEPAEPCYGRKTGLEGFVSEDGQGKASGAGEENDFESEQLAWRMRELEIQVNGEDDVLPSASPQASLDSAYPSVGLHSVSKSPFVPGVDGNAAGDLKDSRSVEAWRSGLLKDAQPAQPVLTPDAPLSAKAESKRPPHSLQPLIVLPTTHTPRPPSNDVTPLASSMNSDVPATARAAVEGFALVRPETFDPSRLPLPDVPDNYVFPDNGGRASFLRVQQPEEQQHAGPQKGETTKVSSTPASPALPPTIVYPSPPSAFSGISTPSIGSPPNGQADERAAYLFPPTLPRPPSNPASLVNLYFDNSPGHASSTASPVVEAPLEDVGGAVLLEREREKVAKLEKELLLLKALVDSQSREQRKVGEVEAGLLAEGIDTRPLALPPDVSHLASANPFLAPDMSASTGHDRVHGRGLRVWVDEHWDCLPWLAGQRGVSVVALEAVSPQPGREG